MTDDRMALLELLEKGADADLVRDMLAFAAERIMEAEAAAQWNTVADAIREKLPKLSAMNVWGLHR
jgi:hypothetical protein